MASRSSQTERKYGFLLTNSLKTIEIYIACWGGGGGGNGPLKQDPLLMSLIPPVAHLLTDFSGPYPGLDFTHIHFLV